MRLNIISLVAMFSLLAACAQDQNMADSSSGSGSAINNQTTSSSSGSSSAGVSYGTVPGSQENFVSEIKQKITLISGDILDNSKLISSMKNHDVVIHLAAKISVSESVKNPKETFDVNVNGTQNVLNSCEKNKISKIIVTSTAAVYQNISTKIILDESSVTNPSSPYGSSKLAMEDMINDFTQTHDVNAIILRLFNVYGVGQSPEYAGVITKFLSAARDNSPLTIFGDGSQTRDFVHVKDVINAIILSIDSSNFGLYNVATGTSTSILNLAHLIIEQSDKKLDIVFNDK